MTEAQATRWFLLPLALLLSCCNASPAQNIAGSFFPAWMLCLLAGIVVAVTVRIVFQLAGLARFVVFPLLTYAGIAVAATLMVWLFRFGG